MTTRVHSAADAQFVEALWKRKAEKGSMFAHAELVEDYTRPGYPAQNGSPGIPAMNLPAGTPVLVTMISRLGHVCFRETDLNRIEHGYSAGCMPEKLCGYRWAGPDVDDLAGKVDAVLADIRSRRCR